MLAVTAWGLAGQPVPVTIMTQNMDAGTDLTFAIGELLGHLPPGVGVELTFEEILAANISGWISAIVHTGDRHFRVVATHLQSAVPGDPASIAVQTAQADQL